MTVGTKSILYGSHAFYLHPFFVAWAWKRIYGFPYDPRLWVAFFVHDLGYWGKVNMDGAHGQCHPVFGARICGRLFDPRSQDRTEWWTLCLLHSRFFASKLSEPVSRLFYADKLAFGLTPRWLYLRMARWSGELAEYVELTKQGHYDLTPRDYSSQRTTYATEEAWWDDAKVRMDALAEDYEEGPCNKS